MSMRDAIASLATGTYTVIRTEAGERVSGIYTPGPSATFPIVAVIQPATGRQLRDLPEGQRGDETVSIFTVTEIRTRMPGSPGNEPDVVMYLGEPRTVVNVKRFESFGEVHYEALAVRAPDPKGVVP